MFYANVWTETALNSRVFGNRIFGEVLQKTTGSGLTFVTFKKYFMATKVGWIHTLIQAAFLARYLIAITMYYNCLKKVHTDEKVQDWIFNEENTM